MLCFRLHFTKDSTTINTAGATVRQLVSLVFERVVAEDDAASATEKSTHQVNLEDLKVPSGVPPKSNDFFIVICCHYDRKIVVNEKG